MAEFIYDIPSFFFRPEIIPILGKFDQKFKTASRSWNLVLRLIRICRIQWKKLPFSDLDGKYPSWANMIQNSKLANYTEILYLDQFKYTKLDGGVHFVYFRLEIPFLGANLAPTLIRICRIQWWCLPFCLDRKCPFWAGFVQKMKNVSLN